MKTRTAGWSASVPSRCGLERGGLRIARLLPGWLRDTSASSSAQGRSGTALSDRTWTLYSAVSAILLVTVESQACPDAREGDTIPTS